jgi:hypothetical protein
MMGRLCLVDKSPDTVDFPVERKESELTRNVFSLEDLPDAMPPVRPMTATRSQMLHDEIALGNEGTYLA